jgi:nicotinamidase-related amidase
VKKTGRKKLVMAALWTEVCLAMPAIHAMGDGYDVYVVTDASGGVSPEAHDMAIRRMVTAGAQPITWLGLAGELQRDWARTERLGEVAQLFIDHAGRYWFCVLVGDAVASCLPRQGCIELPADAANLISPVACCSSSISAPVR